MCKSVFNFVCGIFAGFFFVMLYMHRGVIKAAIKGEEIPKAPKGCPAFKEQ